MHTSVLFRLHLLGHNLVFALSDKNDDYNDLLCFKTRPPMF